MKLISFATMLAVLFLLAACGQPSVAMDSVESPVEPADAPIIQEA